MMHSIQTMAADLKTVQKSVKSLAKQVEQLSDQKNENDAKVRTGRFRAIGHVAFAKMNPWPRVHRRSCSRLQRPYSKQASTRP